MTTSGIQASADSSFNRETKGSVLTEAQQTQEAWISPGFQISLILGSWKLLELNVEENAFGFRTVRMGTVASYPAQIAGFALPDK